MDKLFSEVLSMSVDSAWLIIAVIIVRAVLQKAPIYFRKILWGLVGVRLLIPFSFESAFSLIPHETQQTVHEVAGQVVTASTEQGVSFENLVPVLWLAIGFVLLVYGLISYIKLKLKIIDSILLEDNIYRSEKIDSPFVCGFIKPRIYLPYGLDETTQKCVLRHEKTHIKFADHIIKAVSFVILSVHWFNPLVWVSYFLLCKDIELSCDESVVMKCDSDECKQYAKALLDLGVNKVKFTACPVAFGEVSIKTRIKSVINYKKAGKILIAFSLCLCTVVAVCFMTEPEVKAKNSSNNSAEVVLEETTEPVTEKITVPITESEVKAKKSNSKPEKVVIEETTEPVTEKVTVPTTESVVKAKKSSSKPAEVGVEETTEPVTEKVTESTTKPSTQAVIGAVAQQQTVINSAQEAFVEIEETYDDSIFENEDDGLEDDPLVRVNVKEPDLVAKPDSTSIYEGITYNYFGPNSVIEPKPNNTPELPAITLFPESP